MARYNQADIVIELIELARDVVAELRQQLVYYRASVYKDETANQVRGKVEQLRMVSELIGNDVLHEAFRDHDAMKAAGGMNTAPGECSFYIRTMNLITNLESPLAGFAQNGQSADADAQAFALNLKKHQHTLLALCRYGSRQWSFFQAIQD